MRKGIIRKTVSSALALLLAGTMLGSLVQPGLDVEAAKAADLDTTTKYEESLGDDYSTMYAGRVWTDKTVKEAEDENFGIIYSALSTSQEISGTAKAPLDVVFIIDISGSMVNSASGMKDSSGNTYSRMKFTVDALNESIETLMSMNEHTRVAVAAFSTNASVLLPLGHYEKKDANTPYFSLSRTTPLSEYANGQSDYPLLYTNVKGRTQTSTRVYGGTNIQKGMYTGMNLLTASATTVEVDGQTIHRVPAVVMLSDGAPTYSVNQDSWWAPTGTETNGNGSLAYYGNGMKAMMTAAYMKAAINRNYTKTSAKFYTIGMGITGLSNRNQYNSRWYNDGAKDLAYLTLDPANHWNDNNTNAANIRNAWDSYISNRGTGTPDVTVNANSSFELTHPSANDIVGIGIKSYVDGYYSADTADSVNTVFSNIVNKISVSAPEVPTFVAGNDPLNDGYVVFTDPIGKYMEVKSVDSIIHRGTTYQLTSTVGPTMVDGVTTTKYIFEHDVETYINGTHSLSQIDIVLTEAADGSQTMTISIPAGMIPLRINTIELNVDGSVKTHTHNAASPIRVNYTVGLMDELKNADGTLNLEPQIAGFDQAAYEAYLEENTTDGIVNFYSNLYTGKNIVDGDKAGDATAEFKASITNPFYYMQGDVLLYKDADCTIPADGNGLAATSNYYYKETFYHGLEVEETLVVRTGAQLSGNTKIIKKADGYWYRQGGTVRVNRMLEFLGEKRENNTNTAEDFYAPSYDSTTGNFKVYHGNNGVLGMTAAGALSISKEVTADEGLTAPDKVYAFAVKLTDANNRALTGTYKYEVADADGNVIKNSTISDGGTIELEAGQTAKIINLPPNARYDVTETAMAGFTTSVNGTEGNNASGTIVAGETAEEAFTNHYKVNPATFPVDSGLKGKKVLEGRLWDENIDHYTFQLIPYNDEPLPEKTEITVTEASGNEAEFDFGSIQFTKPGVYRYTITEREPKNDAYIAGISYSRALYRVVVTVTDNEDGTLKVESDIQKLYTDTATPLFTYGANNEIVMNAGQESQDEIIFTNTYSAESVVRVPVALKAYTDHSGKNPLTSGMFKFELTPVGVVENGKVLANTAGRNPMPLDDNGEKLTTVVTENEGINVTFLPVTFTQDDIPEGSAAITFRYQMKEMIPEEAAAENNYTVDGMTYDPKTVEIDITVSIHADSKILNVNAVYPNDENVTTFVNEYRETPVVLGEGTLAPISGTKTLTGRAMKDGESFEFKLDASDQQTKDAITAGDIVLEKTNASVADGADKEAVAFDFGKATFKKQDTYTFDVTETVPADAVDNGNGTYTLKGVTYDAHVCTVTVTVTDADKDSILEAKVAYTDGSKGAVYNNTYKAIFDDKTAISLDGTKVMTGRDLTANKFFFEVTLENSGARAAYVPAAADGTIKLFDHMTYTEAGIYSYLIKEQIPEAADENNFLNGVTYDGSVYRVTVTVTDDLEGNLTAKITKLEKSLDDGKTFIELTVGDAVVFTNTYETTDATIKLYQIEKVLEGREWSDEDRFTFKLSVQSADPADGVILPDPAEITIGKDEQGIVRFNDITFTKPGTYVVRVEEVIPEGAVENEDGTYTLDGITYSTNIIQSTFEVIDNGLGALEAHRISTTGSREFKNIYEAEGTLEGAKNLNVTKNFLGTPDRPWREGEGYTFVLEAHDDVTKTAIENGTIVLPGADAGNAASITIMNDAAADDVYETTMDGVDAWVKSGAFGDVKFTEAGDYVFHIREIAGSAAGVTYDATSRVISVKAEDNGDGTLDVSVVSITGGADNTLTFTNVYDPGDVTLAGHENLHVTKILSGRDWKDSDAFTFTLEANVEDDATAAAVNEGKIVMADPTEITITKGNQEYIHFGNITFKEAGRFEFVVTEQASEIGGVTNDPDAERIVVVKVIDNQDGTLSVAVDAADDENEALTFTNIYGAEPNELVGAVDLKVTKKLEGREWKDGDSFTFALEAADDDKTGIVVEEENLSTAAAAEKGLIVMPAALSKTVTDANGTNFDDITFKVPGVFHFYITEQATDIAGVTNDAHAKKLVVVEVTDNLDGTLTVKKVTDASEELTFTNTYKASDITAVIRVEKAMSGRVFFETDGFEFLIRRHLDNPDAPMPANVRLRLSGAADLDGELLKGAFGEITYTEAGTYRYLISEASTSIDGVTADTTVWEVIVKVTDNVETGKLEATVDYGTGSAAVFTNVYDPDDAVLSGAANLKVTKVIDGRNWFDTDSFTFTLTAADDATKEAAANGIVIMPAESLTIDKATALTGNAAKVKAFGNIVFKEVGEYTFTIAEEAGSIDGMTYDTHSETVVVKVTDDGSGFLKTQVTSTDKDYTFTNTYSPADTNAAIAGKKQLNGRTLKAGEFSFTITAEEGTPLPEKTTVQNAADGSVSFGSIEYKKAGVYNYVITENAGAVSGVSYDGGTWNVTVTVTYNPRTGAYETPAVKYQKNDISNKTGFTFVNTYTTTGSEGVSIDAVKTVDAYAGADFEMKGGEFEFTITPNANNPAEDPIVAATVENSADGSVKFAENAVYTAEGTYIYTIKETAGNAEGVTYDDAVYTVTVTVWDDETKAQLQKKVEITKDGAVADGIAFRNEYRPGTVTLDGKTHLKVNKTFTGRKDNQWLASDVFTFTLAADAETQSAVGTKVILPNELSLTVNRENKDDAYFGDILFTEVGTYTFLITETNNGAGGIAYDSHTMKVTVHVTDNQSGKLLVAAPVITDAGFINKYDVEPVTATIWGSKTLNGRELAANEFEFVMNAVTTGAPMPAEASVKNTADGKVVFAPITFTAAGEYYYEITEIGGTLAGVSYDGGKVEAIVSVTDNHDGTLSASVSYKKNGANIVGHFEFVNTYTATPVSVMLEGLKRVEDTSAGAYELAEAEFEFKLTPAKSNPESDPYRESTAGNNVIDQTTGKFTFRPNGPFTEPGTYVYDITETGKGAAGIEYDASVYQVTVEVEDLGGMLSAKTSITKNGAAADSVVFTNKYVPEAATAVIGGKKLLSGKDLENNEFSFVIEAVNDLAKENLPTQTTVLNDETGVFQFDMLKFKEIGTYIYKVFENAGNKNGISYDDSVYIVEVEVSGNAPEEDEKPDVIPEEEGIEPIVEDVMEVSLTEEPVTEEAPVEEAVPVEDELSVTEDAVVEEVVTEEPVTEEVEVEEVVTEEPVTEEAPLTLMDNLAKVLPIRILLTGTSAEAAPAADQDAAVILEDDEETQNTGELYAVVTIKKGDTVVSEIVFENSYTPGKVTIGKGTNIPLTGNKSLSGRTLEAGEFVFEITTDDANAPLPADPAAINGADGSFEFNQITFDETGIYYYTIVEKNNGIPGITYDKAAYTVKVEITDEGFDGQLDASVTIADAPVIFENKYEAAPAKVQISAAKVLNGRALKADEFEFTIEAVTEGAPLPAAVTAKNDVQGVVMFGEIEFTKAGSYTYKVAEIKGSLQHVTYDANVYEVTVHVTDNLEGRLVAEFAEGFEGIKFVNTYTEPEKPKDEPVEVHPAPPVVSPKTGDGAAIGAMLLLAVVALGGAAGVKAYRRKK